MQVFFSIYKQWSRPTSSALQHTPMHAGYFDIYAQNFMSILCTNDFCTLVEVASLKILVVETTESAIDSVSSDFPTVRPAIKPVTSLTAATVSLSFNSSSWKKGIR